MSQNPFLASANFRKLIISRTFTVMSIQAMSLAIGWHLYTLTKDPLALGLIGLAEAIPAIGSAFFSGTIVDSHKPKRILIGAQIALLVNALALFVTIFNADLLGRQLEITSLYVAIFVSGLARSFVPPSNFALFSEILTAKQIPAAAAWNSASVQMAAVVGPALAGLVYGAFGYQVAFALPATCLLFSLLMSTQIQVSHENVKVFEASEKFWGKVKGGIDFVRTRKLLLSVMSLDMFSVLFGGVAAILPVYADQVLHLGPSGLGYLRSALSLGSVLTTGLLAFFPLKDARGKLLLYVVAGFGLCNLGLAFSHSFWLSFTLLFFSGVFDGVSTIIRSMIMQFLTPQKMRGRVSAISSIFITSSNEIGSFESGVAAKAMGLEASIIFGSCMTLMIVLVTWIRVPSLRHSRIAEVQD